MRSENSTIFGGSFKESAVVVNNKGAYSCFLANKKETFFIYYDHPKKALEFLEMEFGNNKYTIKALKACKVALILGTLSGATCSISIKNYSQGEIIRENPSNDLCIAIVI